MSAVIDKSMVQDINLNVLRRVDSDIEQVLGTAAHVCLYAMTMDNPVWERKNIEGSLFLLKRRTSPRFQLAVLNKLSTENYTETIHGAFDVEISSPYLMYTLGDGMVHGIWFYDEQELDKIAGLLNRVKAGLPKPDVHPSSLQGEMASASAASASDDGAFWDKQIPAAASPATAPPAPSAAAPPPTAPKLNPIENLFRAANLKQQEQQPGKLPMEEEGRTQSGGNAAILEKLMQIATLGEGKSASQPRQQPSPPQPQPQPQPREEPSKAGQPSPILDRLFRQLQSQGPKPAEPETDPSAQDPFKPLPPSYFQKQQQQQQQQQAAAAPDKKASPGGNKEEVLAKLEAIIRSQTQHKPSALPSAVNKLQDPPHQPSPAKQLPARPSFPQQPKPFFDTQSYAAGSRGAVGHTQPPPPPQAPSMPPGQQQLALRQAMSKLVQRPAFLDMLAEELREVGLLQ
ncbi:hypothetical protein DUNSADRAFT_10556 [Dunaliella salina]|uniref:Uncharacterized protein n=1 Tax=Dunaliella salina TaxID=3046 RepID=A0ABQ7GF24_DUNSA|nr:hypothetical protein DUNSADRAFT_10556 [Dunaliella salina]|eukprot:KAF5833206.1 hypothetical protein DUNSADRAFT_10556 [Dunaliella salina]